MEFVSGGVILGKRSFKNQENLTNELAGTARELSAEGASYRKPVADFYQSIMQGGPNAQRVLAPAIGQIRNQYRIAREGADRFMPRGGQRIGAYRDLASAEAGDVGNLFTQNLNNAVSNLGNLGVFSTQSGLGATQNSIGNYNQLGNQQRQNVMSGIQTAGKIAGLGMGV